MKRCSCSTYCFCCTSCLITHYNLHAKRTKLNQIMWWCTQDYKTKYQISMHPSPSWTQGNRPHLPDANLSQTTTPHVLQPGTQNSFVEATNEAETDNQTRSTRHNISQPENAEYCYQQYCYCLLLLQYELVKQRKGYMGWSALRRSVLGFLEWNIRVSIALLKFQISA